MEKLKFGIQIMVLVLAFPVWLYAEMKMTDKAVKNAQLKTLNNTQIKKVVLTKVTEPGIDHVLTLDSFMNSMFVSN